MLNLGRFKIALFSLLVIFGLTVAFAFKPEPTSESKLCVYIRVIQAGPRPGMLMGAEILNPCIYIYVDGTLFKRIELAQEVNRNLQENYAQIATTLAGYVNLGYELKSSNAGSFNSGFNTFTEYVFVK